MTLDQLKGPRHAASCLAAAVLLSGCFSGPVPILPYDVPYTGKLGDAAPLVSPRPLSRPVAGPEPRCPDPRAFPHDRCDRDDPDPRLTPIRPAAPPLTECASCTPPAGSPPAPPDPHPTEPEGPQTRAKGNNGVGNGEDPPPPGNPRVNDGPSTAPGKPGNRGGKP